MRASDLDDFERALLAGKGERNWLLVGLLLSLALHLALCVYFYETRFQPVDILYTENQQTPTFKVRSIDLPSLEKNAVDQTNPAAKPNPDKTEEQLPDEKKSFDKLLEEVRASAAMPDDTRDALPDKPLVEQPDASSVLTEIERSTAQTLANSPNATRDQSTLNDVANSGRPQPALTGAELATSTIIKRPTNFTSKIPGDSAGPSKDRNRGFADLDQLLSQQGPLGSGTKFKMGENQLFQFDSAELQPGAAEQLQKVATLVTRNPKATFSVEGYADSIGTPEYNLDLSQRRADSVKQYLVEVKGINPAQIETHGYGSTKFLVQPNAISNTSQVELDNEIARQQPNRRVVVVVHTTGGN